jgi:hypothetical protein
MTTHTHRRPSTCICYQLADEPDEKCPKHGIGDFPPRCADCGRFMPYLEMEAAKGEDYPAHEGGMGAIL